MCIATYIYIYTYICIYVYSYLSIYIYGSSSVDGLDFVLLAYIFRCGCHATRHHGRIPRTTPT